MADNQKTELKKVGALWKKKSQAGNNFMTGVLELEGKDGKKIDIIVFTSRDKQTDKHPDAIIYLSDKQRDQSAAPKPSAAPTPRPVAKPAVRQQAPAPTPAPSVEQDGLL